MISKHRRPIYRQEPGLGGDGSLHISGWEPSIKHTQINLPNKGQSTSVVAPRVDGHRMPLVVMTHADHDTRILARYLGTRSGYDVRTVRDDEDSWSIIRALEPNLIVVYATHPHSYDIDLIQRIRGFADPIIARISIVVMNVEDDGKHIEETFRAGADDYVARLYEDANRMLSVWGRAAGKIRRPSPLSALLNQDEEIWQIALKVLLEQRPPGLAAGLADLLWQPTIEVQERVRWALQRIGTAEAQAFLRAFDGYKNRDCA